VVNTVVRVVNTVVTVQSSASRVFLTW
jgi:hypothetical protein